MPGGYRQGIDRGSRREVNEKPKQNHRKARERQRHS